MTFSILARDPETGELGGAAATGSLCVGGWVLRGDPRAGLSASQGAAPSTLWGEAVLAAMMAGRTTQEAVDTVVRPDGGRDHRQLAALAPDGQAAAFTGAENTPAMGARMFDGGVVAGNLLTAETVLDAVAAGYLGADGTIARRLLAALKAGEAAGGDCRGLMSAALLVLSSDRAPLSLRIDYSQAPLSDLARLYEKATSGDYHEWSLQVPTLNDPERILD
ncbi:hypothetical protein DEA8626_00466 [Defluviimonas aquaemixtae]|uniref:Fimbrial assembly protein FimA n=1 Tax=Albidovulum aquaemixtae TaxID=1542388 RepID=A0A2R8B320_9RHOB|nr:DUF1028 domain-containing protein [Defluviimonas aquaemixtae]SPH16952.1 hypothetical protein DEA8626_00466 [Defluviimonas aquaemixtae]